MPTRFDYNGDGRADIFLYDPQVGGEADILWQHSGGLLATWTLDGYNVSSVQTVGNPGAGWFVL